MVHSCVDWTAAVPTRKTQLMVLSYGSVHTYAKVPDRFEDLEALARKKFSLDDADLAFYSSCMNFCSETLAEISSNVWEYAAPFIGCITVVEKTSSCQASTKTLPPKATTIPTNSSDAVALPTSVVLVGDNNTSEGTDEGIDTSQIDEAHHTVEGGGLSASVQTAANQSDGRSMPDVVIPLRKSPDRWVAPSMTCSNETSRAPYFPMVIVRKLTGLLNKLSPRNYGKDIKDSLSDERAPSVSRQIITLLNICEGEDGGWVLSTMARLIVQRAIRELERTCLYADLCSKILLEVTVKVRIKHTGRTDGDPEPGGSAFCMRLLSQLRDTRRSMDIVSARNKHANTSKVSSGECQATKCLLNFICELVPRVFNPFMFTTSLDASLRDVKKPTDARIGYICKLLQRAGEELGTKTPMYMEAYFTRIMQLTKYPNLSQKSSCYIQEIIDLRARGWKPRPSKTPPDLDSKDLRKVRVVAPWEQYTHDFWTYYNLEQAENYFDNIGEKHHAEFIASLVTSALAGQRTDALRVKLFFDQAKAKEKCSDESFEDGFLSVTSGFDEILIDAPKALECFAMMLKGAWLHTDPMRLERIANKMPDGAKLIQLVLW